MWHKDAALRCLRCARLEVICTYTYENNQLYSSDPRCLSPYFFGMPRVTSIRNRIQQSLSEVIEGRIAPLLQDLPAIFKRQLITILCSTEYGSRASHTCQYTDGHKNCSKRTRYGSSTMPWNAQLYLKMRCHF